MRGIFTMRQFLVFNWFAEATVLRYSHFDAALYQ